MTNCSGEVEIQYEKTSREIKQDGLKTDRKMKSVSIEFLNHFDHKVIGYVNGELMFEDTVITDDVTGMSEQYFGYNYSNDDSLPSIKVNIEGVDCFELEVLKKYKLIYVFLTETNTVIGHCSILKHNL